MYKRLIPAILSFVLIAAHFFRNGQLLFSVLCFLIPFMLIIKKDVVLKILQWILFIGGLNWGFVTYSLVYRRMLVEMPWIRLFFILLAVTAFTFFSAWLLGSKHLKKFYSD